MGINVGTAVAFLELDMSGFKNGISSAGAELKNFASSGSLDSLANSMQSAGSTMTKAITLPVAGLGTAIANTSANFEAGMSKVSAISGTTGEDLEDLKAKAMEMGSKTKFSATEAADAFSYMAMAGWKVDEMKGGIEGIMNLAAASGEDLALTSDIVTDALTAFGMAAGRSGEFADILAAASNNANTNVALLGESFKYVAPVAGSLGFNAEDTSIALGLMANAGIKGSQSGTSLRAALTNLVKPTDTMAIAMEKYGISITDSEGRMKSLKEIMEMLREKLGGLDEATQANVAATLFGKEAMSGMLAIINASSTDWDKLTNAIYNSKDTALNMSNTMNDNLKGQLTILGSTLESIALQLGEALVPVIKDLVSWLQQAASWFAGLDQSTKETIVKFALIAAAVGPLLMIFAKLITCVKTVVTAFSALTKIGSIVSALPALLNPPVLIIIGIVGAIGLVVYEVVKHWDNLKEYFSNLFEWLKNIFSGFWEWLKGFFAQWGEVILQILQPFMAIPGLIAQLWDNLKNTLAEFFAWVAAGFMNFVDSAVEKFTFLKNTMLGFFEFAVDIGKNIWQGLVKGLEVSFGWVKDKFTGMVNKLKSIFTGLLGIHSPSRVFKGYGINIGEGLVNGVDEKQSDVDDSIATMANKIIGLGDVEPDFAGLSDAAINGIPSIGKSSFGMGAAAKQLNFTPNITMNVTLSDTGGKGTAELTNDLKTMTQNAIKNGMVSEFMSDAFRL